ncbi:MAG: phosphoenolpyruvate--protein phosphotransferase, partial [Lachnospiraceae bacterium]|nr:phosphoenolpyruvate--protein phosphotransferase [Candidatus Equihabitans merdae]
LDELVKEYSNPDEDQVVGSDYWHGETPAEMAQLFEAHAMLIEDVGFNATIDQIMEERGCNVEYAVSKAADKYIQKLLAMEDDYFKERASDIKDVRDRLLYKLLNRLPGDIATDEPVILVADELMPSEAIHLNQDKVLGIVTKGGSENSHTAMLIRNMGIPYICGIGEDLGDEYQGKQIYINADTGEIIADPDEMTLIKLVRRYDSHQRQRNRLRNLRGKADVTLDGHHVKVYCNINSPEDVDAVRDNDGRGIGLFRSEGLFFAYDHLPNEEEQFEAYRKVAIEMEGAPVIVRTLDAGSDKKAQYLKMENERNPALGMRGVRYSLNNIDIFKTQLRAIYRASAYGEMSVMFPLVTSVWEVEECLKVCQEVQKELEAEDQPFDPDVQKGIMIETPAAIMIADELAQKIDFFSVGINDLTQYILACDRMN